MKRAMTAALLLLGASPQDPLVLEAGAVKLGDNKDATLTWSVKVPAPAKGEWGLAATFFHVETANSEEFERGGYRNEVKIDGKVVATLNEYAEDDDKREYEAFVPLPGLKGGEMLEIASGKETKGKNHDDFTLKNLRLAPMRRAAVRVTLDGKAGPAKLTVKGAPRLGPDYSAAGAGRAIFTATGEAAFWIPADRQTTVTASHGPEYTVSEGAPGEGVLTLELKRAVETPGMVGADFHLHARPSGDSRIPLADRVTSCAAEGLEFIVATDHNHATDYGPAIRELKLGDRLGHSMGDEVTTHDPRMGHFNAFPVTATVDAGKCDPETLLERVKVCAKGPHVLQVNHPRDGDIGYFNVFKYDSKENRSPDATFHLRFDAIEVFNGISAMGSLDVVMADWLNLLKHDIRITATGNSDSHVVVMQDAGWPRNYVIVGHDRLPTEDEVVEAVKKHRVMVSSGPIIRVTDEKEANLVGEERPGPVKARIRVAVAPWMEIEVVRLLEDGREVKSWKTKGALDETVELAAGHGYVVTAEGGKYAADVLTKGNLRPWGFTNPVWVGK